MTKSKTAKKKTKESVAVADEDGVCLEEDEPSSKSHCLGEDEVLQLIVVKRDLLRISSTSVEIRWTKTEGKS